MEEYDPYGFNWGTRDYLFGRKGENFEVSVSVIKDYIRKRFESLNNLVNNSMLLRYNIYSINQNKILY